MKQKIFSRVNWSAFCDLFAMFGIGNWLLGAFSAFWCVFLCAFIVFIEHETIIKNK